MEQAVVVVPHMIEVESVFGRRAMVEDSGVRASRPKLSFRSCVQIRRVLGRRASPCQPAICPAWASSVTDSALFV